MTPKKIVQNFYKSDVFLDPALTASFLHPDVVLEWHSTKGFLVLNFQQIVALTEELSKNYVRSKIRISNLISDGDKVALTFAHYGKTIENPREEMLLAYFSAIWEVKNEKLYRGYQMSQLS
jgi:hypothetical protein